MWLVKLVHGGMAVVGNSFVSSRFCRLLTCTWGWGIEAYRICVLLVTMFSGARATL